MNLLLVDGRESRSYLKSKISTPSTTSSVFVVCVQKIFFLLICIIIHVMSSVGTVFILDGIFISIDD